MRFFKATQLLICAHFDEFKHFDKMLNSKKKLLLLWPMQKLQYQMPCPSLRCLGNVLLCQKVCGDMMKGQSKRNPKVATVCCFNREVWFPKGFRLNAPEYLKNHKRNQYLLDRQSFWRAQGPIDLISGWCSCTNCKMHPASLKGGWDILKGQK